MGSMTSPASDSFAEIVARLDARIKRVDEERWLSSRYADAGTRTSLVVLYAFYYELARVRLAVTDQTLGQIRFQWWRDAIEELGQGKVREHDLVLALRSEIQQGHLSAPRLVQLIDDHQQAFLANDRGLEPEGALAALASDVMAPGHALADIISEVAPVWAKLRRGEETGSRPVRVRVPSDLRPALAHLRLRHAWDRGRRPGPTQKRFSILLAVLTGSI